MRLAIVTTHPIQYNAPMFRMLAARKKITIKVFYTWGISVLEDKFDPGFSKKITWDIPLLDGYEYEFLDNSSSTPGSHHFRGIVNPTGISRINDWQPNAILVYGWSFVSHLQIMRYFKDKLPVFFRGDSTLLDEKKGFNLRKAVRTVFLKWVYRHIDFALYVGKNNKQYFLKHGLKPEQLIYCPHAIDNDRFLERDAQHRDAALKLRKELSIEVGEIIFLFAGKLEEKKDVALLLQAYVKSKQQTSKKSHLVIVGNGILERSLKVEYERVETIHFLDFQNQSRMPSIYRLADVFVLPSKGPGETWGLAINEAMACGCAIIASDKCGGAVDLVLDEKNGYVFKSGNGADLSEKLNLMLNSGKLKEMGQFSRMYISGFSFEAVSECLELLTEGITGSPSDTTK